ncbi:MAG: hypothetical protein ACFCU7_17325 [Pleurocapsa sp.]
MIINSKLLSLLVLVQDVSLNLGAGETKVIKLRLSDTAKSSQE